LNPVENLTISGLPNRDTIVPGYNLTLQKGGSLSIPENLNNAWSIRSMLNFGFQLPYISCKLNLLTGINYSLTPGEIEHILPVSYVNPGIILNVNRTSAFTNGVVLASNISENVDFTLSYTNTLNNAHNSTQSKGNNMYLYQTISGKINLLFWHGFLFETDATGQINSGLSQGFNQKFVVWNGSFGKKFLKNQSGELKISVFDLLQDGKNISWNASPYSTQDVQYNTLPRYVMLTFTYTMRNFKGAPPEFNKRRDFYPGGPGGGGFGPRGGGFNN